MKPSSTHVVDVIEAIYREEKSERAWLDGILVAAGPALDRGLGVVGYPFQVVGVELCAPWARVQGAPRDIGRS
jgi:hypothetical protein